jgi:shikimate dehydrogenase
MDKRPHPKIYGLVGFPVQQSLSPLMHNAAFSALGINAEYKLFAVKPPELENFLRSLSPRNIYGLNVTIPYKEAVIPFLDRVSKETKLIGAVNTIKVSGGRLEGFNTDGFGFLRHLTEDLKFNPENQKIAILGAGGAAKAIGVYLSQVKPKRIYIYDVDRTKLIVLVRHLQENFKNVEFKAASSIEELDISGCDLLVNATPVGMKESDPCLVNEKFIHSNLLFYDLIYNPKETKLLKLAKKRSAKVSNGLGMLLYQGALAFELWQDKKAPIQIMKEALEKGVRNL